MSDKLLPPVKRSHLWQHVNRAADDDVFILQRCDACRKVQYPPQEFCSDCLGDVLTWEQVATTGTVLSWTTSHASTGQFFKDKLPLHVGIIKLDCGPILLVYLSGDALQAGERVQVTNRLDKSGQAVFFATPAGTGSLGEFTAILKE